MKKFFSVFLGFCMALTMTSCSKNFPTELSESAAVSKLETLIPTKESKTPEAVTPSPTPLEETEPFEGKIGVISNTIS